MSKASRWCAAALCLAASTARAEDAPTLNVRCGGSGQLSTIGGALQLIDPKGPATLLVSGTCNENVTVQGVDRLTLKAAPGAALVDASGGTNDTLSIVDSQRITVQGFQVTGSVTSSQSTVHFSGNTIRGPGGQVVLSRSQASFSGDVMPFLFLFVSSDVRATGITVQGSGEMGILLGTNNHLELGGGSVVQGNAGAGIVMGHSSLRVFGATIAGNGLQGIWVESGGNLELSRGTTITGNGEAGVSLHDLSFAAFRSSAAQPNLVQGNGGAFDVDCHPQFSATRGALANIGGGTTNCSEP